jgi:hypothetical protein
MSDVKAAGDTTAAATLQAESPGTDEHQRGKYCRACGRWMWVAELRGIGVVWHCPTCHYSLQPDGEKVLWKLPRRDHVKRQANKERKYRGQDPCPRCNRPMWVLEIPEYGSRKQCEDCRISVIPGGAVLEWRSRMPAPPA